MQETISAAKQIENLLVLRTVIEELPASSFVPNLCTWTQPGARQSWVHTPTPEELMANGRCGAAACVGGWVAVIPHFIKQGVRRSPDGAPYLKELGEGAAWPTAAKLFGYEQLFEEAGHAEVDPGAEYNEEPSAYGRRCAMARIDHALEMLFFGPEDKELTAVQLEIKYSPTGGGEHPCWTRNEWRREVENDNTIAGYWDWVAANVREE